MTTLEYTIFNENTKYTKLFNILESYQGYINTDNKYHGIGHIKYMSNLNPVDTYDGDFINGEYSGNGKIIYKSGEIYIGEVENSKRHGNGSMYLSNGKYLYNGIWVNDTINKPIYFKILNKYNKIIFQGFKVNNIIEGWTVTHDHISGIISKIQFYINNNPVKEVHFDIKNFPSFTCLYTSCISSINLLFIKDVLDKLLIPNYLDEMLLLISQEFEKIAYPINSKTELIKENINTITYDNVFSMSNISIYKLSQNIKCISYTNNNIRNIIIGLCNKNTNLLINCKKYINNIKSINNILNYDENIDINDTEYSEAGDFINFNNNWILHGNGIIIKYDNKYQGKFDMGEIYNGTQYYKNKKMYVGNYYNNLYHGIGKLYLPLTDKIKYEGDFLNGHFHGNGTSYYNVSGLEVVEYTGEWVNGLKHGNGTLYSVTGDEIFTGLFDNDQIS